MIQHFQPISVFKKDPYKKILSFPKVKDSEIEKRIVELKKLGVTHVSFTGPLRIEKCNILGKGYVGMVLLAKKEKEIFALKIRRTDSPRKNMINEAKLLSIANKIGIGPKFIKNSKNFLLMEFIDGEKIIDWCIDEFGLSKYYEHYPYMEIDMDGVNLMGEFIGDNNEIIVYPNAMDNMNDFISTVIHEYSHYLQRLSWYTRYINMGYEGVDNPYEMIAETIAINNRKLCKKEILNETTN